MKNAFVLTERGIKESERERGRKHEFNNYILYPPIPSSNANQMPNSGASEKDKENFINSKIISRTQDLLMTERCIHKSKRH